MQKIVRVHMLPTESKSDIVLCQNTDKLVLRSQDFFRCEADVIFVNGKYQYLYFTSDEEIKEGDWFIANQAPRKCVRIKDGQYPFVTLQDGKEVSHFQTWKTKIVATTNPELWSKRGFEGLTALDKRLIPPIPLSFVKQYVEKQVKEVNLEYEVDIQTKPAIHDGQPVSEMTGIKEILKLDSQGCVIISPIEEKIDWEQVFDNAQSMHLQEFISYYKQFKIN